MTLAASALAIRRAGRPVFAGLGFALEPGQGLQILGANGSGKSTLLRILSGLLEPDRGAVTWCGRPVRTSCAYHAVLRYLGHADGLDADLSPAENLRFSARLAGGLANGSAIGARIADTLDHAGLAPAADRPVRTLSQGQRRRVALARLALLPGAVWLLDEPHAGLDGGSIARFDAALDRHLDSGGIAVITTHQPVDRMPRLRVLRLETP